MANVRDIPYKDMMARELQLTAHAKGIKGAKSIGNRKKLIALIEAADAKALEPEYYYLVKFGGLVKVYKKEVDHENA